MSTTQPSINITNAHLASSTPDQRKQGLLGFVEIEIGRGLKLTGITLRRTLAGRRVLSFPSRRDNRGKEWFFIRPLDDETRRSIEHQVFEILGIEGTGQ